MYGQRYGRSWGSIFSPPPGAAIPTAVRYSRVLPDVKCVPHGTKSITAGTRNGITLLALGLMPVRHNGTGPVGKAWYL